MGAVVGRALLKCALVAGLIGAGSAVYSLHVYGAVGALIVASVSGLVLLRVRSQARGESEADVAMT
ncbi:hypothetical protein [Rhodococcus chondri]|uniref:Uncharacterized protein n=1 Tax=Rhodococcus chondri TaxID=3065941 RepID=A0ABU7JZ23_9NOCA|nr:hypothetical protein [Rhodococcus sp. CC-R104]MEE2035263.1 hypothetical protein [Rhodococcus sp. CC-R104]